LRKTLAKSGLRAGLKLAGGLGRRLLFHLDVVYDLWGIEAINRILLVAGYDFAPYILRYFGARVGENTVIHAPLVIHNAENDYSHLAIGERCHLGRAILLDLAERITIESQVTISMRATILTHFDAGFSPLTERGYPRRAAPLTIRSGAYIGANATLLAGVTVGECALVAAGALVRRDVERDTVVAGVPAQFIRKIEHERTG
jgi:acetyltransferase-like isoleucine patch superfamily enzyme